MRALAVALVVGVAAGASAQPASAQPAAAPPAGAQPAAAPSASAQAAAPWTKLFLWRIDGPRPSYLFGTMHLPDPRTQHLPPALADALAHVDGVALEMRMDLMTQVEIGMRMRAPRGQSVRDLAPPELRARLQKIVGSGGMRWTIVEAMRPWMAAIMLGFVGGGPVGQGTPIDVVLHDWAIDHGKPSDGLETVAEQATMGDRLSTAEQLELLADVVERAEKGKLDPAPLREAYFSGDERRALALLHEPSGSRVETKFERIVLDERNTRMAERIAARLQTGTPTLFAVGLAHVIGNGGIVARLERAGYKLTRVR